MDPPLLTELQEPVDHGRFKPNKLDGYPLIALKVDFSETIDWEGTPTALTRIVKHVLQNRGFDIGLELEAHVKPKGMLGGAGHVTGLVSGERDLKAYMRPMKKRYATSAVLAASAFACSIVAMSNILIGTPHFLPFPASFGLLVTSAILFSIPLLSIGRMDFWSDLAIAEYESKVDVDKHLAAPTSLRSAFLIRVSVGRGWTQNWQSKADMGRKLKDLTWTPRLDMIDKELVTALRAGGPLSIGNPD